MFMCTLCMYLRRHERDGWCDRETVICRNARSSGCAKYEARYNEAYGSWLCELLWTLGNQVSV